MLLTWAISLLQLLCLTVLGAGVFACLPPRWRIRLLPLLPIAGLALAVVVLHLGALIASMRSLVWLLPVAAALLGAGGMLVHRTPRVPHPRRTLAGAGVVAVPGLLLASIGKFGSAGPGLVQSSFNNDAFYYTSVARWLLDNPSTTAPAIGVSPATGADSPAFGPAATTIHDSLRYGQELVSAWFSAITGIDLVDTFTSWSATWVVLIGLAAFALVRTLPFRTTVAVIAGLAVSLSAAVLFQVAAQNADSLAGTGLALAGVAAVVATLRAPRGVASWLPGVIVGGLLLGALAGTYSEYLAFVGPVLVIVVLAAPRLRVAARLGRGAAVVGVSAVVATWPWIRAVQNVLFISSIGGQEAGLGWRATLYTAMGPVGDVARVIDERVGGFGLVVAVAVVVLVAAVVLIGVTESRTRALAIAVGVATVVTFGWTILRGNAYMVDRSADLVTPFLVVVIVTSGAVLASRAERPGVAAAGLSVLAVGGILANSALFAVTQARDWSDRTVDADYREVREWITETANEDGSDVSVAVGDFFDQLWISDALADRADVAYLTLRGDLGYRARLDLLSYWDGELDRYLLVGPGVAWSASDAAILERNDQFALLDTEEGGYAVAVPTSPTSLWAIYADPNGTIVGGLGASFLVLTDDDEVTVFVGDDSAGGDVGWQLSSGGGWGLADSADGRLVLTRVSGGTGIPVVTSVSGDATSFVVESIR